MFSVLIRVVNRNFSKVSINFLNFSKKNFENFFYLLYLDPGKSLFHKIIDQAEVDWDELEAQAASLREKGPVPGDELEQGSVRGDEAAHAAGGRHRRRHARRAGEESDDADRGVHPFERVSALVQTVKGGREHGVGRSALTLDPFETSVRGGRDVGIAPIDMAAVARPGLVRGLGQGRRDQGLGG